METIIANYTLPAVCHVVCTLLATGISTGINVTTPVPAMDQLQTFPEGYVAHPDVGFAYRVHNQSVATVHEAKRRCTEEGAQLALIDSTKKLEYVMLQKQSLSYAYVRINRQDAYEWVDASTGLPVSSVPWANGSPVRAADRDCVLIVFSKNGLGDYSCTNTVEYVCELPILEKNTLPAN